MAVLGRSQPIRPHLAPAIVGAAGTGQALAGSSDAVSATTGALTVAHSLIGSSDAVSATTGALTVAHSLAGSSDAVSATTGALTVAHALVGSSAAQSATTGALAVSHSLAGTSTVVSSVTGALAVAHALAGTSAGQSATTGSLIAAKLLWPTTVDSGGRYIKDQNGDPWMMHGDAAWKLFANLNLADSQTYIDDRASRGVNAIIVESFTRQFTVSTAPANVNGDLPFTGTVLQSSLGSAYWSHVDDVIAYGQASGITFVFFVANLGFVATSEGWRTELTAASNAQVQSYGSAIGTRYKDSPNVIWVVAGDANPTATEADRYDHIMQGIQSAGDSHLATAEADRNSDGTSQFGSYTWFTLNTAYSYDPDAIANAATAYNESTVRPFFLIEGKYQHNSGVALSQVRREQWQTVLVGGIGGHTVGNESVWPFGVDNGGSDSDYAWASHLADQSSTDATTIRTLFDDISGVLWSALTPDLSDVFLTSGEGSGTSQAAASYSTEVGLVYLPAARSITVAMTVFTGHANVTVRWFDPTNASYTSVGSFSTSGSQTITHPGNNAAGDPDWVLRVDATGVAQALAGTSAGQSATTGDLSVAHSLIGSSAAVSTTTGSMVEADTLAATSAAQSATIGALSVAHALTASSDAVSTVTGALIEAAALAGTATGLSATLGDLSVVHSLAGSSDAVSSTSGTLVTGFNGQSDAVSATTGALTVAYTLAGSSDAISATTGALALAEPLSGSSAAQSATSGDLVVAVALAASSDAVSSTSGDLDVLGSDALAGTSAAQSAVIGELTVAHSLVGASTAISTAVAVLTAAWALAGTVAAQSGTTGSMGEAFFTGPASPNDQNFTFYVDLSGVQDIESHRGFP